MKTYQKFKVLGHKVEFKTLSSGVISVGVDGTLIANEPTLQRAIFSATEHVRVIEHLRARPTLPVSDQKLHLTAAELCDISGLTLEEWGIDETTRVVVSEDFVNGYTASGHDLPDLCAGATALQERVWQAALKKWG